MKDWFIQIDGLLRAQRGDNEDAPVALAIGFRRAVLISLLLGSSYGLCMGLYSIRTNGVDGLAQMASSMIKLPLLFLSTLLITFPSLYVFGALAGSELDYRQSLRASDGWIAIMLAVGASLGPILGFFTLSTQSYAFIVLLNVVFLGIAGVSGSAALARGFGLGKGDDQANARGRTVFVIWVLVFGLVGLQMAWVMRPFIGAPGSPFVLFRGTDSNAFAAILNVLGKLIGIEPRLL
jgi:uncharacterized membrane protein YesL